MRGESSAWTETEKLGGLSTTVAAVGLSTCRYKTISAGNPAEGGHAELLTTVRLRERVNKRDREKNLISRSQRRRGGVSRRVDLVEEEDEGGEENDGESFGSEEDDEVADGSGVPRTPSLSTIHSASNQHDRSSLPLRVSQRSCKVADEMTIGVPVPRKTRSASAIRSHENTVSGSCGGRRVFGEERSNQNRSNSTETSFPDLISASSSNIVITNNIKSIESKTRTPPSSVHQDDIEFEIAEVLSGLMKQRRTSEKHESPRNLPQKTEPEKINYIGDESRRSISFPFAKSSQTTPPTSVLHYGNTLFSDPSYCDDVQKIKADDDRAKTTASIENELLTAGVQIQSEQHVDVKTHQKKVEKSNDNPSEAFCDFSALKDKSSSPSSVVKDADFHHATMKKEISFVEERREEKLKFDLMTSSLKSSPPVVNGSNTSVSVPKPIGLNTEMNANVLLKCEKKVELSITKDSELEETHEKKSEEKKDEKFNLYFEKQHIDDNSKLQLQDPKPHSKDTATKVEKNDSSFLSPLADALDWSYRSLPPFKWMSPSQAGSLLSNMAQTPRKCVTHYYIARNIYSHQQCGKMNYFFEASNVSQASKLAAANLPGHSDNDKSIEVVNFMDRSDEKHLKLQESQSTPTVDLLHGSVFETTTSQHQRVPPAGVRQPEDLKFAADSMKNAPLSGKQVAGALPPFAAQNTTLSYSYPNSALNQAPYLAILPNKGTPLPISTPVGSTTAYKASTPPQAVHFLNGLWYPPHIHHSQPQHQPPQTIQHPWSVQATGNNIYLLGSSDMQPQQSVRQHPPPSNQAFKVEETTRNNAPSASDSKALNSQKGSGLFTLPVQMLNFSLGPSTMLGEEEDGNHGGNQPKQKFHTNGLKGKVEPLPSQPVAMQFASFNGNGSPSNLSFRTVSQKLILFQNPPDQAIQQKNHQPAEKEISGFSSTHDEYKRGNSGNSSTTAGTLVFNHPARTLNFTQPPTSENWPPRTITSAAVLAKGSAADRSKCSQQQVLLPLQQQQILQQSLSARSTQSKMITRNSIPFAPHAVKSPNSAIAFQQPLIMCNSSVQSSQAKNPERSMNLHVPAQQGKAPRGQTQISFGGTHKPSLVAASNSK